MLSPRYLDGLTDELVEIYSQLETDILKDMARRIKKLGKITDATKWQAQMLAEAGGLKANIGKTLKNYDKKIIAEVTRTYTDALRKNTENDNKIFIKALGRTVSEPNAQQMLATIQKCHSDLSRLTLTTAATSETLFVQQANNAYMKTQSGAFDYDTAMKDAADAMAERGITAVQYRNGTPVTLSIEHAIRMNILTSINQTAANMTLNNCEELDCDLVETSAHIGARPEHEEWQGQIFSRSGNNPKYRPFSVCELGSVTGICGINCRHSFYPYFEGMHEHYTQDDLDEMANEKISYDGKEMTRYEAEQKQRHIEKQIRYYKRRALTEEAAGADNTAARVKLGEWQAKARDFVAQTGLKRDTAREFIGTKDGIQPKALKPNNTKVNPETIKAEYNNLLKKYDNDEAKLIANATKAESTTVEAYKTTKGITAEDYIKAFNAQTLDYTKLTDIMLKSTTSEQQRALTEWTGGTYGAINAYMRNGANANDFVKNTSKQIHEALNNCKHPSMYVRRGARYEYLDKLTGDDKWRKNPASLIGQRLNDKGFLATTPDKKGGFSGDIMIYYKVPSDLHGAYIDSISIHKGEMESLFNSNTKIKILEVRTEVIGGHTRYIILGDMEQ